MPRTLLFRVFLVLLLVLGFGLAPSYAQNWNGIISPSRAVNWSQAGIPGGIPNRTTICATLNPGASGAQISSAIQSCPPGQVVYLNAGTYNISDQGIDFANTSNVTLRGAGADKTFLVANASVGCYGQDAFICIENGELNWQDGPANSANWTGGYTAGTTVVTLSSTANLHVGGVILLDQTDETSDNGNIFDCQFTASPCNLQEGGSAGRNGDHARTEMHTVTAISGNSVSIAPPLAMTFQAAQSPGAWWATTNITQSGVEDLSIDATNLGVQFITTFFNSYECWVKGVRSLDSQKSNVHLDISMNDVIENDYFYGTQSAASQSYGVEMVTTGFDLVQNNIFQKVTTPIQAQQGIGDVWAHNFNIFDYYSASAGWMIPGEEFHTSGNYYYLLEGNEGGGSAVEADNVHGESYLNTVFRNWYVGWCPATTLSGGSACNAETIPVQLYDLDRYFNVIGNVLGEPGYHTNYQDMCPNEANGSEVVSIYSAGWSGNNGGGTPCDSLTATSLMRWGNWDTVTSAAQWNSAEVPTGDPNFPNSVPASHTLPASFYLPGKPSWWGSMPFPAIGPDVSGGNASFAGHVYNNPAATCYYSTMGGPTSGVGSALSFNESSCYGSGSSIAGPPAPPTNLTAVAH